MEEFDKETVKKLMENLVSVDNTIRSQFRDAYCLLSNAKSIGEVMIIKKELLLGILKHLPMDGMYCYFCLCTTCESCSYERAHGRCGISEPGKTSTWAKIMKKRKVLYKLIEKEYWTGKELKEEVANNEKK